MASPPCSATRSADRALVVEGVPWLARRSRGLGPMMVRGLVEGLRADTRRVR